MDVQPPFPIFLKPDALDGPYATVRAERAADYAYFLAAFLNGSAIAHGRTHTDQTAVTAAWAAFTQMSERAQTETAFASPIVDRDGCKLRLLTCAKHYEQMSGAVATSAVIKDALEALGMQIVMEGIHTLSESDIDAIYREAIAEDPLLKGRLYAYLAGKRVQLVLLGGNQSVSALQAVKTYARYFFRYQPGERHRLENLMHVPDGHDITYLWELAKRLG
jgi:hypothetical protein